MEEVKIRYRGRTLTECDVDFIRDLIARHPEASRRALSKLLCEAWNWRQANGELRDMVEVIIDRRIRERRRAHRPVETDRRKGVDRRLS